MFDSAGLFTFILKQIISSIIWSTLRNGGALADGRITKSGVYTFLELEFIAEDQAGKIIGVLERTLYTYGLFSNKTVIIGGILTFKAFSGWINIYDRASASSGPLRTPDEPVGKFLREKGELTKIGLYIYAVGNFLSLALSVFCFECVRWLTEYPGFSQLLLVGH